MTKAKKLIQQLQLQPHPEGGWYRQSYKSEGYIPAGSLPIGFRGKRAFSTLIYFLLEKGEFSGFHRIKSDECWHFYTGDPMELFILDNQGGVKTIILGNEGLEEPHFQFVVPADFWFACRPAAGSEYCLTGCTVAPGFEFADFELADADDLVSKYPAHEKLIRELCV